MICKNGYDLDQEGARKPGAPKTLAFHHPFKATASHRLAFQSKRNIAAGGTSSAPLRSCEGRKTWSRGMDLLADVYGTLEHLPNVYWY